jgi:uncharacterized protein (DUF1501 family)
MPVHSLSLNRRGFLGGATSLIAGFAAGVGGLALPRRALAAAPGDRRFLFVFNNGGWDPTRVFAPEFDSAGVAMEAAAERATAGNISYVDHPDRPSVRAFFEANHSDMLVLNGVQVRSIAHEICTMIALTGDTSGFKPDFATVIASHDVSDSTLPHLVLDGPSFPGDLGTAVARSGVNGQLESLLSGEIRNWTDTPVSQLPSSYEGLIDRYVSRRVRAREAAARSVVDQRLAGDLRDAADKALGLEDFRYAMDFASGSDLATQGEVAVNALATGLSRCVSLGFPGFAGGGLGWDSHTQNDDTQSQLFEGLFSALGPIVELLRSTPGHTGGSLFDETIVVVQSEMGRTPALNATLGKDHWPYTSVLLMGGGLTTDRVVGGFDAGYAGQLVDFASGELADGGKLLSAEAVGAALLAMAGVDPGDFITGADPLEGILS